MGKISRSWSMMSASWHILKQDKQLLVFPLISGICCILLLASFAIPIYLTGFWEPPKAGATPVHQAFYYGTLFLFYFLNYFIIIFFNSAIVGCAVIRMQGGEPTVALGMRMAMNRLPAIVTWALISATVGLILRVIEERAEKVGQIVTGLLGAAWTVVTFMVVPILVVENLNPFAAMKESAVLLKKTWGERAVSRFGLGILFLLLGIPGFALIILGIMSGSGILAAIGIGLGVIYFITLALVQSALHSIFQAAIYLYARDGVVPAGFEAEALSGAMSR